MKPLNHNAEKRKLKSSTSRRPALNLEMKLTLKGLKAVSRRVVTDRSCKDDNLNKSKFKKTYEFIEFQTTETTYKDVWVVHSNSGLRSFLRYLFLKLIYDELTKIELGIFLISDFDRNPLYLFALKAKSLKIPRKIIREICENSILALHQECSRSEYNGSRTQQFKIEFARVPASRKKGIKYSGYSRHHKDQGNLPVQTSRPEPTPIKETSSSVDSYFHTLMEIAFLANETERRKEKTKINHFYTTMVRSQI